MVIHFCRESPCPVCAGRTDTLRTSDLADVRGALATRIVEGADGFEECDHQGCDRVRVDPDTAAYDFCLYHEGWHDAMRWQYAGIGPPPMPASPPVPDTEPQEASE